MRKRIQDSIWNYAVFGVLFLTYLAVTMFLFHRQSVGYGGKYVSDMPGYIAEIQGVHTGLFPYPVMFWVAAFFSLFMPPEHGMALAVTLLNSMTFVTLKVWLDKKLAGSVPQNPGRVYASSMLAAALLFVSMITPIAVLRQGIPEGFRYQGIFSPNPWHNATYLAARPFAIITFFLFLLCMESYEQKNRWFCKEYVLFSVFLLAATMTKPSFTLIFLAAAGIMLLYRLLKSRGRGWKAFLQLGIYFIPTLIDLLYQYSGVFVGTADMEEKGIGIGWFAAWGSVNEQIPLAILSNLIFPLAVLWFQRKEIMDKKDLLFAWGLYGVGLFTFALFYEKGYRMGHLNFAWGYMYGIFFLFAVSGARLLESTLKKKEKLWKLCVQWGAYVLHLGYGLYYFSVILSGEIFW